MNEIVIYTTFTIYATFIWFKFLKQKDSFNFALVLFWIFSFVWIGVLLIIPILVN